MGDDYTIGTTFFCWTTDNSPCGITGSKSPCESNITTALHHLSVAQTASKLYALATIQGGERSHITVSQYRQILANSILATSSESCQGSRETSLERRQQHARQDVRFVVGDHALAISNAVRLPATVSTDLMLQAKSRTIAHANQD